MNGTIEKQGAMLRAVPSKANKPTIMERRQAEKCVMEIVRLGETGVTIQQVERFLRALAILGT